MPRRLRIHVPGGFYHVTLRGNHRQPIFGCAGDRALLNKIVARAVEKYDARLHAYCWMSNHIHLLIQVGREPLAHAMRQIGAEFARAMQTKLATTGHFFERRFHAVLVEDTQYLLTVLRYVHLNPVEAGITDDFARYPWSSHSAYMGLRHEPWLTTEFLLGKFGKTASEARAAYMIYMDTEPYDHGYSLPEGACIFGSDEFVERIRAAEKGRPARQSLDALIVEACQRFEVDRDHLNSPVRDPFLTKVRAWIANQAVTRGVATCSAVARALGRSEATLREAIRRYPTEVG